MTKKQVEELVEAYEAGATVKKLGEQFGINRKTVGEILKREGVTTRWRRFSEADIDRAESLYAEGFSTASIAERFGASPDTIRMRLIKRGVKMRDAHERP